MSQSSGVPGPRSAPAELWGDAPAVDLPAVEQLRWTRLETLFDARNEKLFLINRATRLHAEAAVREGWLDDLGYGKQSRLADLTIEPTVPNDVSRFVILGDPGEGDVSQYAVVRPMLARHRGESPFDFAFVLSDVIYPAGDSSDYPRKFYGPYHAFDRPIFAVPGNHDWDDGSLTGFMTHFAVDARGSRVNDAAGGVRAALRGLGLRGLIWRGARPASSSRQSVAWALEARDARDRAITEGPYRSGQPGSYFRLRAGQLWFVCIDTGMTGTIDHDQGEWLLNASSVPGPKILLTGKPLIVDGKEKSDPDIIWDSGTHSGGPSTVLEVVRNPEFAYVAAIGGDVHNYQRYSSQANDGGRGIAFLVAGGSGAFLASTEFIGSEGSSTHAPMALYPDQQLSRVHFEIGVATRIASSRLLGGLAMIVAVMSAPLFVIPRGANTHDIFQLVEALVIAIVIGVMTFGLYKASPGRGVARSIVVLGPVVSFATLWGVRAPLQLIATGVVLVFATLVIGKLAEFSGDWGVTLVLLAVVAAPLIASLVVSWWSKDPAADRWSYTIGYIAIVYLIGLGAAALARKLAAPEGATIRDHRPYATTILASSAWLFLMVIMTATKAIGTVESFTSRQWAFVAASALAVLFAGMFAHPRIGWHLAVVTVIWLVLVVGGFAVLFVGSWHSDEARLGLKRGVYEGATVTLAAFLIVTALLSIYAAKILHPYRRLAQIKTATGHDKGFDHGSRHELISTILRAVGRLDWLGPIFESSEPPMLKSFLEVEVATDRVRLTAFRASGFEAEADAPVAIDSCVIEY